MSQPDKLNTRFNPTVNGRIHLGHVYLVLVNEHMAHSTGGAFGVRFDDNQYNWLRDVGAEQMELYAASVLEDLDWLGVRVASVTSQAATAEWLYYRLHSLGYFTPEQPITEAPETPYTTTAPYPYVPYYTAEKVVYDHQAHINLLIRGEDLLSEYALYQHFCDRFGFPRPKHIYLPRLMAARADAARADAEMANENSEDGFQELDTVSKTQGKWKIATLRDDGMTPSDIRRVLSVACLDDRAGKWDWRNIRWRPTVRAEWLL